MTAVYARDSRIRGSKRPLRQIRVSTSISSERPADDVEAVCLAEPLGARAPEAGRGREDQRAPVVVRERLERVPFDGRALVDVAAEDELRAGGRERPQHRVAVLERELPRGAPRRPGEVVVADDDPQRAGRGVGRASAATDARRVGSSRPP